MDNLYLDLQDERDQSVSAHEEHPYEEIRLPAQPTITSSGNQQMKSPITTVVKVTLVLLSAVALLGVVMAAVAVYQNSELKEKIRNLEQAQESKATAEVLATSTTTTSTTSTTSTTTISPSDTNPNTSCYAIHSSYPYLPSGVYIIHIGGRAQGQEVWCDMEADDGGWTRFQRRQDGTLSFNRTWQEYSRGFGSASAEFWLGNEDLHLLTAQPAELRVDLWDFNNTYGYAQYSNFSIGNSGSKYQIHVGGYKGTIGDSLAYHNSQQFITTDLDNGRSTRNCATMHGGGGWWYKNCHVACLNGRYRHGRYSGDLKDGVVWPDWRGYSYSLKAVSMMVRPRH